MDPRFKNKIEDDDNVWDRLEERAINRNAQQQQEQEQQQVFHHHVSATYLSDLFLAVVVMLCVINSSQ